MAQANINIRMDADLKRRFELLCKELGLNLTTAFTIFAKQSVRENKLPVSLEMDPFYSKSNVAYIQKGIEELDAGKGILMSMEDLDAIVKAKTSTVDGDPFYSKSNVAFLKQAIADLDAGKGVEHDLIEVD